MTALPLNLAYLDHLRDVLWQGHLVEPRGMLTKEMPQKTLTFHMRYPVLTIPARKLGYRFLAAEAWWLLSGRNDVRGIAPYSKRISEFSDDGETFFGSYGPPFVEQLTYVVDALRKDPDTRQATMTFWRPNPPPTKDVPCTIALDFKIRGGCLNLHVFMRSSDVWLGIPYDSFNFTMMACRVLEELNGSRPSLDDGTVHPGVCFLTAASSHLYERNWADAEALLKDPTSYRQVTNPVPENLYGVYERQPKAYDLVDHLFYAKEATTDDSRFRWWVPR